MADTTQLMHPSRGARTPDGLQFERRAPLAVAEQREAARIAHGKRAKDEAVEDREECRVRADPEREGQHGNGREAGIARDLPAVQVDALQIEQVVVNLVRNAAEALTDAGRYDGKVAIEAERDASGFVVVRVRDNGPGFDPDLAERAVAPFTTTRMDGLGLGLSLARSIVEAHGGRLSVESGSSGATVSFTLPVQAAEREGT